MPWAEYRDGKWQIDIPPQNNPSEFVPDDSSLADRMSPWFEGKGPLNKWYYSDPSGKMTLIKASETARKFDSHCQYVWGLEADFRKKPNRDGFYENVVALNVEKNAVKMVYLSSKSRSIDSMRNYLSHDKNVRLSFEKTGSEQRVILPQIPQQQAIIAPDAFFPLVFYRATETCKVTFFHPPPPPGLSQPIYIRNCVFRI